MAIDKRKIQEVNAGSMADIAFLLLIFFLVATTMNTDSGINRTLPAWSDKKNQEQPEIHERDLMEVRVSQFDDIMVNGERIGLLQLKDKAKEFLLNVNNDPNMPEKEMRDIEGLGRVEVSKGIISLQNARQTSYDMYIKVQNELTRAINEIRDMVTQRYYGMDFAELKDDKDPRRVAILQVVPTAISEAEPVSIGGQ